MKELATLGRKMHEQHDIAGIDYEANKGKVTVTKRQKDPLRLQLENLTVKSKMAEIGIPTPSEEKEAAA